MTVLCIVKQEKAVYDDAGKGRRVGPGRCARDIIRKGEERECGRYKQVTLRETVSAHLPRKDVRSSLWGQLLPGF